MSGALTIAGKYILHTPLRSAGLALAIAATLSTVLVLEGFQSGLIAQMRELVRARGADLIALQPGATSFLVSRSKLPQSARAEVEAVRGVSTAEPMILVPVIFEHAGRKTPIVLLVSDGMGGPRRLRSGRAQISPKEVIVDASLAAMHNLALGDSIVISDYTVRVGGISEGEAAMFTPVVFISYDDLIDLYFSTGVMGDLSSLPLLGFLLIKLAAGADPVTVQARIEQAVPSVDVLLPQVLAENEARMGRTLFGPVLSALITVSYLICLMVIGLIIYANASARIRTYGVLMALGFRRIQLLLGLALEGLGLTALALPPALAIALALGVAIEFWSPLYSIRILETAPLLRTALGAFTLSLLGTGLAYQLLARLDPSLAFRR